MRPVDDELRAVLSSRADAVAPAPDPMAGVEARAARLRRGRLVRAVTGAALAVALIGVAVPLATGAGPPGGDDGLTSVAGPSPAPPPTRTPSATPPVPPPATTRPSAAGSAAPSSPAPTASRPAGTLDWPATPLTEATSGLVAQWAQEHPGAGPVRGEALLVEALPTGDYVQVLQLWRSGTAPRTVVGHLQQTRTTLLRDDPVDPSGAFLRAVVPGDATPYVVVVGEPGTTRIDYAADGVVFTGQAQERTAVFARTGPTGTQPDLVRTLDARDRATVQPADPDPVAEGDEAAEPANVLTTWPVRGTLAEGPSQDEAAAAFAAAKGSPGAATGLRVLFAGATDGGLRFLVGQAWIAGGTAAHTIGYSTGGESGPELFLGPPTPTGTQVVAHQLCCSPGASTDTLVVVPEPGTGQVLYAADDTTELGPVGLGQDHLDGVVLVDRDPGATTDQLRLLDGDGRTTWSGAVAPLLCGVSGCG